MHKHAKGWATLNRTNEETRLLRRLKQLVAGVYLLMLISLIGWLNAVV